MSCKSEPVTCELISWEEVPEDVKEDFDWVTEDDAPSFFVYNNDYYCLSDCVRLDDSSEWKDEYDGIHSLTAFSCLLVTIKDEDNVEVTYCYS